MTRGKGLGLAAVLQKVFDDTAGTRTRTSCHPQRRRSRWRCRRQQWPRRHIYAKSLKLASYLLRLASYRRQRRRRYRNAQRLELQATSGVHAPHLRIEPLEDVVQVRPGSPRPWQHAFVCECVGFLVRARSCPRARAQTNTQRNTLQNKNT